MVEPYWKLIWLVVVTATVPALLTVRVSRVLVCEVPLMFKVPLLLMSVLPLPLMVPPDQFMAPFTVRVPVPVSVARERPSAVPFAVQGPFTLMVPVFRSTVPSPVKLDPH